jgi:RNA polymerase sigma-70 factor, ECF subfamily
VEGIEGSDDREGTRAGRSPPCDAHIPYRVPDQGELPGRLRSDLAVVYLIFNEGYTASSGDELARADLCAEAIRLGRLLAELLPDEPEVVGLLGLMLLIESRRPGAASFALTRLGSLSSSRVPRFAIIFARARGRRGLGR